MKVLLWSSAGDTLLKEYDPATADMSEVNAFIDEMEKQHYGRAFNLETGEQIDRATPEDTEVHIVGPNAGG